MGEPTPASDGALTELAQTWLESPAPSTAQIDAAEREFADEWQRLTKLQREEKQRDLLGDVIVNVSRRRMKSARSAVATFRHFLAKAGVSPLDVMARAMMLHVERGDWDRAVHCAALLAPYTHPRLSVIAVPAGSEPLAGVMRFTWEQAEAPPP